MNYPLLWRLDFIGLEDGKRFCPTIRIQPSRWKILNSRIIFRFLTSDFTWFISPRSGPLLCSSYTQNGKIMVEKEPLRQYRGIPPGRRSERENLICLETTVLQIFLFLKILNLWICKTYWIRRILELQLSTLDVKSEDGDKDEVDEVEDENYCQRQSTEKACGRLPSSRNIAAQQWASTAGPEPLQLNTRLQICTWKPSYYTLVIV